MADDLLVTHRALADPNPLNAEDLLHHQCLRRLYHQPLLGFGPTHLRDRGGVAEGRDCAVPEAVLSVATHGVAGELGGLARLVLVEVGKHRPYQVAFGVLSDLLGYRDDPDTGALQLAAVVFQQVVIANSLEKL